MKLYEVPPKTWIRVIGDIVAPPGAPEIKKGDKLYFYNIDGMYSYCKRTNKVDAEELHLVALAEVEIVEDHDEAWLQNRNHG